MYHPFKYGFINGEGISQSHGAAIDSRLLSTEQLNIGPFFASA